MKENIRPRRFGSPRFFGIRLSQKSPCSDGTQLALARAFHIREDNMQIGVEASRAIDNKRIFVIDEDEVFRAALQFMLHDENEAHEVATLEAAFEKAREKRPDLVLVAEAIVRERGLSVLAKIGALMGAPKIIVVVESAKSALVQSYLTAGAHGIVAKPLSIEFVRQKVDVLLGRRNGLAIPLKVLGNG